MLGKERPLQYHERLSENGRARREPKVQSTKHFFVAQMLRWIGPILILQDMGTWKENYSRVHFSDPNEYFSNVFMETQKSWVWERRVVFQPEEIKIKYSNFKSKTVISQTLRISTLETFIASRRGDWYYVFKPHCETAVLNYDIDVLIDHSQMTCF